MATPPVQYCGACGATVPGTACESCGLPWAESQRLPAAVLGEEFTYGAKTSAKPAAKPKKEKEDKRKEDEDKDGKPANSSAVKGIFQKKKAGTTVYEVIYEVNSGLELQDDKPRTLKANDELTLWMKRTQDDPPNLSALEGIIAWWNTQPTPIQMAVGGLIITTLNVLIRNSPTSFFVYLLILQHVLVFLIAFISRRVFRKADRFYTKFTQEHSVAAAALQRFIFPVAQKKLEILQLKLWYKRVKFSAIIGGVLSTAVVAWFIPPVVLQYVGALVGLLVLFVGGVFAVELAQVYVPYADYFNGVAPVGG